MNLETIVCSAQVFAHFSVSGAQRGGWPSRFRLQLGSGYEIPNLRPAPLRICAQDKVVAFGLVGAVAVHVGWNELYAWCIFCMHMILSPLCVCSKRAPLPARVLLKKFESRFHKSFTLTG